MSNGFNNSRLFDPYRWSNAPQVKSACTELMVIFGFRDKRYVPHVMMVLLDLYCSWRTDPTQYLSYARDKNRYGKHSRYTRVKVGRVCLLNVIDALRGEGYIDHVEATCYRDPVTGKPYAGYSSRMRATRKLIRFIVCHRIKLSLISRHPNEAVIYVRDENKDDVKLDAMPSMPRDVERSEKILIAYNHFLQKTYIDLDDEFLTTDDVKKMKKWPNQKYVEYSIDLSRKRVYRVFSNSKWNEGGRIYGAWWQSCPKQLRKYIVINGEPTIELDYSSIHILLLYAYLGENFLDEGDDAYTIEGYNFRKAMKTVIMSAINAKPSDTSDGDTRAVRAAWKTLVFKCNEDRVRHGITSPDQLYPLLDALKERHQPIARFLSSGKGIELMKQDSDIAIELIKRHMAMNVPILTVHDSFIVPLSFMPFTIDLMNQVYGKQVSCLLGGGYNSEIETIDTLNGTILAEDITSNINVEGLIKPTFSAEELSLYRQQLNERTTSSQMRRYYLWNKNRYQVYKVSNYVCLDT